MVTVITGVFVTEWTSHYRRKNQYLTICGNLRCNTSSSMWPVTSYVLLILPFVGITVRYSTVCIQDSRRKTNLVSRPLGIIGLWSVKGGNLSVLYQKDSEPRSRRFQFQYNITSLDIFITEFHILWKKLKAIVESSVFLGLQCYF